MRGFTIWLTGLPSSGKTTLGRLLAEALRERGRGVALLDGDEMRKSLTADLGFSRRDRDENVRRLAYVAKAVNESGGVAIVCAISPYRAARAEARRIIMGALNGRVHEAPSLFLEIYLHCPVEVCQARDVKGLYAKALRGELERFTGVSDPYEPPENPEVMVNTTAEMPRESAGQILSTLASRGYLERNQRPIFVPNYLYEAWEEAERQRRFPNLSAYVTGMLAQELAARLPLEKLSAAAEDEITARLRTLGYLD